MITVGDEFSNPRSPNQVLRTVLLSYTGAIGETVSLNFLDDSITYFNRTINQSFEDILIDNIGEGQTRVSFNKPGMVLTSSIAGAKTLKTGDNIYVQESIRSLDIYFIEVSTVELILMTK